MDSKIIAAIIIAVGFVAGVYIYVSGTPFNTCVEMHEKELLEKHYKAVDSCLNQTQKNN